MDITENELEPQQVALARGHATEQSIASVLPELLAEVVGAAHEHMSGPPFVRYLNMDGDAWDIEAGVPVSVAITPRGRVEMAELPGGRAVSTWHVGPYPQLKETYEALEAWLAEHALRASGPSWEVYWSDPNQTPAGELRTEIVMPVESA